MSLVVACLLAGDSAAQTPSAAAAVPSASGEFRTGATFYENFFQEPDGGPGRDVWAGLVEVRLENPFGNRERLRAYTRIEFLQFREIGSSPGVVVGVKGQNRINTFDVSGGMQWNRPRSDVGDELETADLLGGMASYTFRGARILLLTAQGEYREEFLRPERVVGSRYHEYGGGIGVRLFGGRVVPEIGVLRGVRDTSNARDEYLQETEYVALRTSAIPRVYITARYRERLRKYTIQDIGSSNFGRRDYRENVSASLAVTLGGNVSWNVSGGIEEGESSRAGRAFVSRYLGTGIAFRY